jgi:hypothetical protein
LKFAPGGFAGLREAARKRKSDLKLIYHPFPQSG